MLFLAVVMSVLVVALAVQAKPARSGGYGPCCPLVKGQAQPTPTSSGGRTVLSGPRYVCQTTPITLVYNGATHAVDSIEVTGSLLVPARLLTMTGADLEWGGQRHFVLTRGSRRVELTLGSHAVTISKGGDTQMVSWPLCPRLLNGISYAPLRPLAEALGLEVSFQEGVVTLTEADAAARAPASTGRCPADRVEEALGVTIVRSPADSAFGVGAGIEGVTPGGLAASFGVQPKDVIRGANGQPVKCPIDLDRLLTRLKADNGILRTLDVARGTQKVTLQAKAAGQ
ncbi:MAG: stalk domain-containing protein [Armatimonadia bacterium]